MMSTNTPASKSQKRALALFGLTIAKDSYIRASEALGAAGLEKDGVPVGHDWKSAKQLSDADLKSLLIIDMPYREDSDAQLTSDHF